MNKITYLALGALLSAGALTAQTGQSQSGPSTDNQTKSGSVIFSPTGGNKDNPTQSDVVRVLTSQDQLNSFTDKLNNYANLSDNQKDELTKSIGKFFTTNVDNSLTQKGFDNFYKAFSNANKNDSSRFTYLGLYFAKWVSSNSDKLVPLIQNSSSVNKSNSMDDYIKALLNKSGNDQPSLGESSEKNSEEITSELEKMISNGNLSNQTGLQEQGGGNKPSAQAAPSIPIE